MHPQPPSCVGQRLGHAIFSLVCFSSSSVQKRGFRYGSSTILADFYSPLALRDYPAIFKLPWSFEEKSEKITPRE